MEDDDDESTVDFVLLYAARVEVRLHIFRVRGQSENKEVVRSGF